MKACVFLFYFISLLGVFKNNQENNFTEFLYLRFSKTRAYFFIVKEYKNIRKSRV